MSDALTQPFIDRREGGAILAQQLRLRGHTAILVDDGLATGSTMQAVQAARKLEATRVVARVKRWRQCNHE